MDQASPSPASIAALRDAIVRGREPPPAEAITRLHAYPWIVVGTACIGSFMGQLDSSIAQLLLPRLEHVFDARLSTVSWVAVGYLLTMAAFLPIFGRLADMFGRKLLYTVGFLLFVLGALLSGFAPNLPVLIVCRVLQALAGALLSSNSVAIIVMAAGAERRGRALGIQSAAQAVGLAAGPAVGGVVMHTLDWQWVFWINVPFCLIGAVLGWFVLPVSKDLPAGRRFDWAGAFLLVPALTALVTALNEGHAWGQTAFLLAVLLAVVLLMLFVRRERRAPAPLVDLKLFGERAFAAGNLAGFLSYAVLFGILFLMPFVFIRVCQDSALVAGLRLTVVPAMLGLVAPVGGALADRFGSHIVAVSGMAVCVAALALLFAALHGAHSDLVTLALALFGLGQGLFISPNNSTIMAAAPAGLTGEAGALMNVTRFLGIGSGIASSSSLLSLRLLALTGVAGGTVHAAPLDMLAASRDVVLPLMALAAAAGAISLLATRRAAS